MQRNDDHYDGSAIGADRKRSPALARLGFTDELELLSKQGHVSVERRPGRRPIYRIRFRRGTRQVTRYIGVDAVLAEQVRDEIAALQASRTLDRQLRQLAREARKELRKTKRTLTPMLERAGFHFHGFPASTYI